MNWDKVGWKVDVRFIDLLHKVRPKDHMEVLRQHLPTKYSPLSSGGAGSRSVYLAEMPGLMAAALNAIIGPEVQHTIAVADTLLREVSLATLPAQAVVVWEEHLRDEISGNVSIPAGAVDHFARRTQAVARAHGSGHPAGRERGCIHGRPACVPRVPSRERPLASA
jgi:hypothetical protein